MYKSLCGRMSSALLGILCGCMSSALLGICLGAELLSHILYLFLKCGSFGRAEPTDQISTEPGCALGALTAVQPLIHFCTNFSVNTLRTKKQTQILPLKNSLNIV